MKLVSFIPTCFMCVIPNSKISKRLDGSIVIQTGKAEIDGRNDDGCMQFNSNKPTGAAVPGKRFKEACRRNRAGMGEVLQGKEMTESRVQQFE